MAQVPDGESKGSRDRPGPEAGVLAHPTGPFLGNSGRLLTETDSGQILGSSPGQPFAALEKLLLKLLVKILLVLGTI